MARSSPESDFQVVVRRALDLANVPTTAGGPVEPASLTNLPPETVREIAGELGIAESALAQALAEHFSGSNREVSLADRVLGPSRVSASHRCGFDEKATQEHIQVWLQRGHGLRTRTSPDGVVVGHRRRGAVGRLSNSVRKARGEQGLSTSREVRAAAVGVGEENTGLSVVADVTDQRAKSLVAGAVTTAGAASVSGLLLLVTSFAAVGLPVALAGGYAVARLTHRATVRRVATEVEITVDAIAVGEDPPNAITSVTNRFRRT